MEPNTLIMEQDTITSIVSFIAGIFCIILFVKVWIMTNDIKRIKKRVLSWEDSYNEVRIAWYKGDVQSAQDLLNKTLIKRLITFKRNGRFRNVENIINTYEPIYRKMGFEIPESILRLREYPVDILEEDCMMPDIIARPG
jgi:hypothetical protein